MLIKPRRSAEITARDLQFAIVAPKYNSRYVDSMVRSASALLDQAQAARVQVVRVPGAFEIPVIAAKLARNTPPPAAIICLGVVIRGQTAHAQLISEALSHALAQIQTETLVPVIHEVLLLENDEQAKVRCLDPEHNRGVEAAQTALTLARLMSTLNVKR